MCASSRCPEDPDGRQACELRVHVSAAGVRDCALGDTAADHHTDDKEHGFHVMASPSLPCPAVTAGYSKSSRHRFARRTCSRCSQARATRAVAARWPVVYQHRREGVGNRIDRDENADALGRKSDGDEQWREHDERAAGNAEALRSRGTHRRERDRSPAASRAAARCRTTRRTAPRWSTKRARRS